MGACSQDAKGQSVLRMSQIKKVLIANRGEIALRIIRTCREKNIPTVALYSDSDSTSPHVLAADESVYIGASESSESYLNTEKILNAAQSTGSNAIHPGYGFLSENGHFAELCRDHDLIFIGPGSDVIHLMGDKTTARSLAEKVGIPYPPGSKNELADVDEGKKVANSIGFPVLIKAAAGGGGKGMRVIHEVEEFEKAFKAAKSEAKNAFGDDRVFVEKYLENPRHIEIQIFADQHGNVVHLFERECSIQRRHQKVIEESPSVVLDSELRAKMGKAAVDIAKACNYVGAGTVEFLVDKHRKFYFLEMNTRLQVEHPVTELITGLDLVSLQIDVSNGLKLPFSQDEISFDGHAIECRIYAEDPENHFLPSTGKLLRHRIPSGPGVRVDSGIEEGQTVSIYYDPMISKLCVYASNRQNAIQKMKRALIEYDISGVSTTIPFCISVMENREFQEGNYDTHYVQNHFKPDESSLKGVNSIIALVSSLIKKENRTETAIHNNLNEHRSSGWWEQRKSV